MELRNAEKYGFNVDQWKSSVNQFNKWNNKINKLNPFKPCTYYLLIILNTIFNIMRKYYLIILMFLSISNTYSQTKSDRGTKWYFPDTIVHSFHNPYGIELLLVADTMNVNTNNSEANLSITIKNNGRISYLIENKMEVSIYQFPGIGFNVYYENDTIRQTRTNEPHDCPFLPKLRNLENGQEVTYEYQLDFKYLHRNIVTKSWKQLDSLIHSKNQSYGKYYVQAIYYMPESCYKNRKRFLNGPVYSNIIEIKYSPL